MKRERERVERVAFAEKERDAASLPIPKKYLVYGATTTQLGRVF